MTQLGELRDAYDQFLAAGIKLYAVSYDDAAGLAAFADANEIPFPLLSDLGSHVIREYGILNTLVREDELPFHGIPFRGTYVVDEAGIITEKFFPRHIANRESAETVIESALGRLLMGEDEPTASGGDDEISITASFHGGGGTFKAGVVRSVVVRFKLPAGMHIYGEPVPEGMVPTTVTVSGPEGLVVRDTIFPQTTPLVLREIDQELQVWSGSVEIRVPVWANSHLIHPFMRAEEGAIVPLDVAVRYQACDDNTCMIPRTERFALEVPVGPYDKPNFPNLGEGGRVTTMDSAEHFKAMLHRSRQALDEVRD